MATSDFDFGMRISQHGVKGEQFARFYGFSAHEVKSMAGRYAHMDSIKSATVVRHTGAVVLHIRKDAENHVVVREENE